MNKKEINDYFENLKKETIEKAYSEWLKGNYYKYNGGFYVVGTDEYICPID